MTATVLTVAPPLARLTPEDASHFEREGYATLGPVVCEEKLQELDTYVTRMIADLPPGKRPEELDMPHPNHAFLREFCAQACILDLVEPILGPNIVHFASHFICKPKGNGKAVPWHQDSGYWTKLAPPRRVVTVWLAVDDSTVENGCMRVIPGTHKHVYEEYVPVDGNENVFKNSLDRKYIDETKIVNLELPRGHCSLHDGWTIHGSNPNHSDKRRCGYTMRYFSVEQECLNKEHPLYLVRGEDRVGKNDYRKG